MRFIKKRITKPHSILKLLQLMMVILVPILIFNIIISINSIVTIRKQYIRTLSTAVQLYINDKNEFIACNDVDKITHAILTYYSDSRITVDNSNQDKVTCIISIIYERNMSDDEMPFTSMLMYEL